MIAKAWVNGEPPGGPLTAELPEDWCGDERLRGLCQVGGEGRGAVMEYNVYANVSVSVTFREASPRVLCAG